MKTSLQSRGYPYHKNRVYLSAVITLISVGLAITLLKEEFMLIIYYITLTFILTIISLLLKMRLYYMMEETKERQDETEIKPNSAAWKTLLYVLLISLTLFSFPLLLAGFLSGPLWFISIISFTSGVSISEIILFSCVYKGKIKTL
jgi:L-asparagine transporter-like permease